MLFLPDKYFSKIISSYLCLFCDSFLTNFWLSLLWSSLSYVCLLFISFMFSFQHCFIHYFTFEFFLFLLSDVHKILLLFYIFNHLWLCFILYFLFSLTNILGSYFDSLICSHLYRNHTLNNLIHTVPFWLYSCQRYYLTFIFALKVLFLLFQFCGYKVMFDYWCQYSTCLVMLGV